MSDILTFPIRSDKLTMSVQVTSNLAHVQTDFQTVDIVDTAAFGRMLFLDGHVQLAEFDEAAYHESLVHPAVLSVPAARRALVIGGGDGAVVRELCRHKTLEQIEMVEIDRGVIDACEAHMPFLNNGTYSDPRVKLHITDAFEFVKTATPGYDIIVMDSTDVYEEEEGELSAQLWTDVFYADLKRILNPKGIVVTQADNLVFCPYSLEEILGTFGSVFEKTGSFFGLVPSFGGYSGFAWASPAGAMVIPTATDLDGLGCTYLNEVTANLGFSKLPFGK